MRKEARQWAACARPWPAPGLTRMRGADQGPGGPAQAEAPERVRAGEAHQRGGQRAGPDPGGRAGRRGCPHPGAHLLGGMRGSLHAQHVLPDAADSCDALLRASERQGWGASLVCAELQQVSSGSSHSWHRVWQSPWPACTAEEARPAVQLSITEHAKMGGRPGGGPLPVRPAPARGGVPVGHGHRQPEAERLQRAGGRLRRGRLHQAGARPAPWLAHGSRTLHSRSASAQSWACARAPGCLLQAAA